MRPFIEHLLKGTIPHDMVEEFRDAGITFYDNWLIVKVVDHRNATNPSTAISSGTSDDKPFSINNYNPYITPSPHAPYPTKQQTGEKTSPIKHEKDASIIEKNADHAGTSSKPKPKIYHVGLRPTGLSKHQDMVLDATAPDPKSLNRKQSQANMRPGGVPQTPTSGVPATPLTEKGPPLKKQKMKIDSKDLYEYEARVINATAPPLYLEPVANATEAEALLEILKDPFHDQPPPSPKSRKRTIAELAADDAHAKQQERYMLVMDERNAGSTAGATAANVDSQAANTLFQPRFEKFNALESIKRDMTEKKQQEKDRQLQEDENRRDTQQRLADEERRKAQIRNREQQSVRLRQAQQEAHNLALQQQAAQQQAVQQAARQQQQAQMAQQAPVSGIPPQTQNQVMANQQRASPILQQGTPQAASSPVINQFQGGGAGSPPRPGSALQHSHPMARGASNQSRHGTPQIPNATPGMRTATPVLRQGTPGQHMTQPSPHNNMMAQSTPQMGQAVMGGQMTNGMHPQQVEMQRRHAAAMRLQAVQQQQQQQAMMAAGNPQMAHSMAQQAAMHQRQAAMQQQQLLQQQSQQMGNSPAQAQGQYNKQLSEQMKAQMQGLQTSNQGSPMQTQITPQQQAAMMHQQQQQQQRMMSQQGQGMGNMQAGMTQGQQQRPTNALQQFYSVQLQKYQQQFMSQLLQKAGGNFTAIPDVDKQRAHAAAQQRAREDVQKRQQNFQQQQQVMRQQQAMAQQHGMVNGMNMMNPNMAAMQQQQQAAQQMQGMQMVHAQQMMAQQQQQQGQPNVYAQMQMQQQQQQGQRQG